MAFETEKELVKWWFHSIAKPWGALSARLPGSPNRWLIAMSVVGLAAYAFIPRCLHLLDPDHHYLVGPDSHFFHWLARWVMAEGGPPSSPVLTSDIVTLHSGLAYPLAYIAKAVSSVFNMSHAESLDLVSKFLPPLLGVLSLVVIYLVAAKIYSRRVGLFSAFAWAVMLQAIFIGAAGRIDRDGLSVLLIMIGAFTFYLSRDWRLKIGNRDVGWLLAGLGVLGVEGLLWLEWTFVGPALLLVVLTVYFVVRFLLGYLDHLQTEPSVTRRLTSAISEVNWRAFALIILGNIVVASFYHQQAVSLFNLARAAVQTMGQSPIVEMSGIGLRDILAYGFLLIPIAVGLYLAWKKRFEGSIFFSCWFLSLLVLSLFARRVLLYATPAACLLSGVGLVFLWDWGGRFQPLKKVGVAALVCLAIFISVVGGYTMSSRVPIVGEDWQDALAYLRDNTPEEAVIMSQWSWGYWILDVGQRRPLVDNGYYGWGPGRLHDIGVAYTTTKPTEAVEIMEKYGADYIIFSEFDRDMAAHILELAGLDEEYDEFPEDSLVSRSLDGKFEREGGLEVVYRSEPDSEVVILGLTQIGQP